MHNKVIFLNFNLNIFITSSNHGLKSAFDMAVRVLSQEASDDVKSLKR